MACEHEYHWYLAINEEGWRCCSCGDKPGEPPGYSPRLDRDEVQRKVWAVLSDLHDHNFVHVSNGSHGDFLTARVADQCVSTGRYDQKSIALFLLESLAGDGEFWKLRGESIIAGNDNRDRCHCGALARVFSGGKSFCFSHHMDDR